MSNIRFSIAQPDYAQDTGRFITTFAEQAFQGEDFHLGVKTVPWERLWYYIQTKTFERADIEVSEVGTTWLESLADADALAELSETELDSMGGRKAFTDAALQSATVTGDPRILAVPWLSDTRIIFYWRDMLEQAGVHESSAFIDADHTRETLEKLHRKGGGTWGVPTFGCSNTLHHAASWIWGAGGDLVAPGLSRTSFCAPEALRGFSEYFSLCKYMRRRYDSFLELIESFKTRQTAAVMDGPWLFFHLAKSTAKSEMSRLGAALPPGPPFIGGSDLILWKHTEAAARDAAVALIRFLTSDEMQPKLCKLLGLLPVKKAVCANDSCDFFGHAKVLEQAVNTGRHLPKTRFWAPLETSLTQTLGLMWQSLASFSDVKPQSIEGLLRKRLEPLAKRFDKILEIF